MKKKLKAISLFSWAGWKDLWFILAWFDIIRANDFDKDAVETYKKNIWDHIVLDDITKIPSSKIPSDIDLIIWWFPCQWFSVANNNRSMEDQRNFLYKEMLRIVWDKKPKFFVAENVKWLVWMNNWDIIKMIVKDFENIWYKVNYKILNSADYWVPQFRERVIIIWNNIWVENPFPNPTHGKGLKDYIPAKDVIWHLYNVKISEKPVKVNWEIVYNHNAYTNVSKTFMWRKYKANQEEICDYLKHRKSLSNWTVPKIDKHFWYKYTAWHWFRKDNHSWSIPKPSDWLELKKILWFDNKFDEIVTEFEEKEIVFEQSLRINNWDTPSDTITATWPEIHPNKNRRLSVRETALIQTFPNDFIFIWSLNTQYRQIWNAVPVKFAEAIATPIRDKILNFKK